MCGYTAVRKDGRTYLSARCYDGAVYAMALSHTACGFVTGIQTAALCLSVCLSVISRCSVETTERIELSFCTKASVFSPRHVDRRMLLT